MKKLKTIILANEIPDDHHLWIKACDDFKEKVEYRVVNLTGNNWLEEIQSQSFDILLAKPGGLTTHFKQLYDERIYILERNLGYKIYPSAEEIFIYENKRFLSSWLKANNIPHPQTDIFYDKKESLAYLKKQTFPLVGKVNIGASGSGVTVLKNRKVAKKYITRTFAGKGSPQRSGPNLKKGGLLKRISFYFNNPTKILKKYKIYKTKFSNTQKGFVIFQEYIPHEFEWRVVRIGNSFFAHKKLKIEEKASGSLLKGYDIPSFDLLNFVKRLTDMHHFFSQAIDIFESPRGYLVNEMQCIFGQSDPHQMILDGKPGRYIYINGDWFFEEGYFTDNECFNLRISFILENLQINFPTYEGVICK